VYDHIFNDHNLKPIHQFSVFNNSSSAVWPSVIIIFCFGIFIFLRISSYSKVINTFRSSYSMQSIKQLEREEFNPFNPTSFGLSLLFILLFSFFIYKINSEFNYVLPQKSDFTQYLFFVGCMCVFLPVKFGIRKIIGHVSNTPALTTELFYNNLVINQTLGLLLLPIMVVAEFSKANTHYALIVTVIVFAASLIIKLYRGVLFSLFENHIGLLQVFIYLCALEILPFLVFLKFLISNF